MALDSFVEAADSAVVIVTVDHEGERAGCLVGFHSQCSIEPERYAVFLSKANHTFRVAGSASRLAVHLLAPDQGELAVLFGGETDDDQAHKFMRVAWSEEPGGAPVLDDAAAWFVGDVIERVDCGDHVAFVIAPDRFSVRPPTRSSLRYREVLGIEAGHEVD